jgi:hypothetical protein
MFFDRKLCLSFDSLSQYRILIQKSNIYCSKSRKKNSCTNEYNYWTYFFMKKYEQIKSRIDKNLWETWIWQYWLSAIAQSSASVRKAFECTWWHDFWQLPKASTAKFMLPEFISIFSQILFRILKYLIKI